MPPLMTSSRIRTARIIAVAADAVQLGLFPLFIGGAPEGFDAALDAAVGLVMVVLLGWHLAFLPSFVSEALPFVDLFPTWTLAVLYVTRGGAQTAAPPAAAPAAPAEKITDLEPK
jgi:hypothetical protein